MDKTIKIINCTPHDVTVVMGGEQNISIPRSRQVARCSEKRVEIARIDGIPIWVTRFGAVENLPKPAEGTWYIVSRLVAMASTDRHDLLVPDQLIRNEGGGIVGCQGFSKPR